MENGGADDQNCYKPHKTPKNLTNNKYESSDEESTVKKVARSDDNYSDDQVHVTGIKNDGVGSDHEYIEETIN